MLFYNPIHGGQSQPCPLAEFLSSKEGLEEAIDRHGSHANAGVGDRKHHVRTGATIRVSPAELLTNFYIVGLDDQTATPRHRVPCIDAEIHGDLANLRCIALYYIKMWRQNDFEFDVLFHSAC